MEKNDGEFVNRFCDDLSFHRPGDTPTNLPVLLSELGVRGEPYEVKKRAVLEWLEANDPTPFLRHQLLRDGYLDN